MLGRAPAAEDTDESPQGEQEEVGPQLPPILWHSNAPWCGSGYGTQTALFVPRIRADLGYPVAFSAFFGLKGRRLGWVDPSTNLPFTVYPGFKDNHGNDILAAHAQHWFMQNKRSNGLVIMLSDPWVLRYQVAQAVNMCAWVPVDHDPAMPQTVSWFKQSGALPIAMSRWGKEKLEEAGIKDVQYVPHGYNPEVFRAADRKLAREILGIPKDAFVVGMVANNLGVPSRKCFAEAFQAFAIFQRKHPDAILYLHTLLESVNGEDLLEMADTLGIRPISCDQYALGLGAPDTMVSATHNAMDVLLNPAQGEGFGVSLIEAQACGTPCIVTNFSASPEVAPWEAGNWNVNGQRIWTGFKSWQMTPSVEGIVEALEQAYDEPEFERLARRASVQAHAASYTAEGIVRDHWAPTLDFARAHWNWRKRKARRYV